MATQTQRIENRIQKLVSQHMTIDNIVITLAIETGSSDRIAIRGYVIKAVEKLAETGDPAAQQLLHPHG